MISEKNYEIIKSAVAAAKRAGNEIREEKYLNSLDPSSNFRKLLEGLTKAELQEIRRSWAFSDISHLNKAELIEELALRIEENLADWFSLLNLEQLQKVKEIISHDGFLYLEEIDFELLAYYREKGVIFSGRYNGQVVLLIPGELLPKMRKIISNNNVSTPV